jgi:hypothetical protein
VAAILDYLEDYWESFAPTLKNLIYKIHRRFFKHKREVENDILRGHRADAAAKTVEFLKDAWMDFGRFFAVFLEYQCALKGGCQPGLDSAEYVGEVFKEAPFAMLTVYQTIETSSDTEFIRQRIYTPPHSRPIEIDNVAELIQEATDQFLRKFRLRRLF